MIKFFKAMFGDVREYFREWSGWILFTVLILYYELLFHGMNFSLDDGNIAAIIAFAVVAGGVFGVLTGFFPPVINKILATLFTLFTGVIFIAQYVYHSVFNNYLSVIGTIKFGNQAVDNIQYKGTDSGRYSSGCPGAHNDRVHMDIYGI